MVKKAQGIYIKKERIMEVAMESKLYLNGQEVDPEAIRLPKEVIEMIALIIN